MVPLSFCHAEFALTDNGALYWPHERALLIADLHLEKASHYARYGQMLPPYDSRETLQRVTNAIRETGAKRVFTLGDNFHDAQGGQRLEPYAAGMLETLERLVDWVWIEGNHDHPRETHVERAALEELEVGGIILRHEAKPGETRPELSGHFHPKMRVRLRGRSIARRCAVLAKNDRAARMVLPAFGALTGGMDAGDPAIMGALQPARKIEALVPAAGKLARFPLWQAA